MPSDPRAVSLARAAASDVSPRRCGSRHKFLEHDTARPAR